MKFKEIKNEGLEKHFDVTIPSKEIEKKISDEIISIAKKTRMPGFRVGKTPIDMVKKKYEASVRNDVVSHEIRHAVSSILKDGKYEVAGTPSVENLESEAGKDLKFTLEIELMPEIVMPDFKKIKLTKPVVDISEKDVKKRLDEIANLSKSYTETTNKKAKAADGDMVVIDFVGSVDGVEFEGGAAKNHSLVLGSKSFIPGFEDQLIGAKVGDEIIVKVPFPKEYHAKNLAGKDSEFKVTIHTIKQSTTPEMNDAFAVERGFKDLEDLKTKVQDRMLSAYDDEIHTIMKMKLFNELENSLDFEAPKNMVEREYTNLKSSMKNMAESDPSLENKTEEELDKYYRRISLRRVKIGLLLSSYVKTHNLKIEGADMKAAVMREARNFPGQEQAVIDYYSTNKQALESLTGPILEEKAVKEIFKKDVTISEKKYSTDALEKLIEEEAKADLI